MLLPMVGGNGEPATDCTADCLVVLVNSPEALIPI